MHHASPALLRAAVCTCHAGEHGAHDQRRLLLGVLEQDRFGDGAVVFVPWDEVQWSERLGMGLGVPIHIPDH